MNGARYAILPKHVNRTGNRPRRSRHAGRGRLEKFLRPNQSRALRDALIPDTLLDQELPQDDPIDLPDLLQNLTICRRWTWATNLSLPTPSVGRHSIGLDPTDFLGAGTRHYLSVRARVARDGVQHGVPKAT